MPTRAIRYDTHTCLVSCKISSYTLLSRIIWRIAYLTLCVVELKSQTVVWIIWVESLRFCLHRKKTGNLGQWKNQLTIIVIRDERGRCWGCKNFPHNLWITRGNATNQLSPHSWPNFFFLTFFLLLYLLGNRQTQSIEASSGHRIPPWRIVWVEFRQFLWWINIGQLWSCYCYNTKLSSWCFGWVREKMKIDYIHISNTITFDSQQASSSPAWTIKLSPTLAYSTSSQRCNGSRRTLNSSVAIRTLSHCSATTQVQSVPTFSWFHLLLRASSIVRF